MRKDDELLQSARIRSAPDGRLRHGHRPHDDAPDEQQHDPRGASASAMTGGERVRPGPRRRRRTMWRGVTRRRGPAHLEKGSSAARSCLAEIRPANSESCGVSHRERAFAGRVALSSREAVAGRDEYVFERAAAAGANDMAFTDRVGNKLHTPHRTGYAELTATVFFATWLVRASLASLESKNEI